jgi:hypothetical protein
MTKNEQKVFKYKEDLSCQELNLINNQKSRVHDIARCALCVQHQIPEHSEKGPHSKYYSTEH